MNIGKLDRIITLQRPVVVSNGYGEDTTTWVDVKTVKAGKKFDQTTEAYAADQKQATQGITWRIRWFNLPILPTYRVKELGSELVYYLTGLPVEVERRHTLDLKTEYRG